MSVKEAKMQFFHWFNAEILGRFTEFANQDFIDRKLRGVLISILANYLVCLLFSLPSSSSK
jgi:hypothetical protein